MRPLAVLILILGAIASLLFAINSILDGGGRGAPVDGNVVRSVHAREEQRPADPDQPLQPAADITVLPGRKVDVPTAAAEDRGALTGILRGEVQAPDGSPVEDASVSLIFRRDRPMILNDSLGLLEAEEPPKPLKKATTDNTGRFEFRGLEPGNHWSLVVTHKRFARSAVGPIDIPVEGGIDERVTLVPGLALFGVVLDEATEQPIEGATLVIDTPLASFVSSARKTNARSEAVTDATGTYAFHNIGNGQRTLTITAEGYATQSVSDFSGQLRQLTNASSTPKVRKRNYAKQMAELAQRPEEPIEWNFRLQEGKQIAGRVLGPDMGGLSGVRIDAINQSGSVGSRGSTVSRAGGEFLVSDLGEGVYTLRAEAEGFQSTPLQRIEVGTLDVELVLARQGGVTGRVEDGETGKTVRGFTVRVRQSHPSNPSWGGVVAKTTVRDSSDGSFSLSGISEGDYIVEGFSKGYASSFSQPFHVDQGIQARDVVVRLTRGGTLKGRVIDSYSGEPIQGAIIKTNDNNYIESEIMMLLNSMGSTATSKATATTNANGEFEAELLTPDTYQIRVEKPGYTAQVINDVRVDDGPATEVGPFSLAKGATVTGVVYGPLDELIAGGQVTMRSTDSSIYGNYQVRSDGNGRFVFRNVKAGSYALAASRPTTPNSNPFAPVVDIQNSEIEIDLLDGGSYEYDLRLPPRN